MPYFFVFSVVCSTAPFSLLKEESRTKVGLQLPHLLYKYYHLLFQKEGGGGGGCKNRFLFKREEKKKKKKQK
jgi:hypothetical protein